MSKTQPSSTSRRVLGVLIALRGHTLNGLSNKELSEGLGYNKSAISRAITDLVDAGLVVRLDNGRYAHSMQMLQIAYAHADHIKKAQTRMAEIDHNLVAGSF